MSPARKFSIAICLLIPYAALVFPALYNRPTPVVLGLPFFYWYQLGWVILTSVLLLFVHRQLKRS